MCSAPLPFLCSYEGHVMEVEMARELISLLLTHGLFLLAGDRVSNSISQVFIYYFPFQSWGIFLKLSPSTSTLRKKKKVIQVLQLPSVAAVVVLLQLNYKILAPFSVKITHCGRPYIIWTGGFVTENNTMQLGFLYQISAFSLLDISSCMN